MLLYEVRIGTLRISTTNQCVRSRWEDFLISPPITRLGVKVTPTITLENDVVLCFSTPSQVTGTTAPTYR